MTVFRLLLSRIHFSCTATRDTEHRQLPSGLLASFSIHLQSRRYCPGRVHPKGCYKSGALVLLQLESRQSAVKNWVLIPASSPCSMPNGTPCEDRNLKIYLRSSLLSHTSASLSSQLCRWSYSCMPLTYRSFNSSLADIFACHGVEGSRSRGVVPSESPSLSDSSGCLSQANSPRGPASSHLPRHLT